MAAVWRTARDLLQKLPLAWAGLAVGFLGGVVGLVLDVTGAELPLWAWGGIAISAVLAALIQLYHRVRVERDAFRPTAIPDMPVHFAYEHLRGRRRSMESAEANANLINDCIRELEQAARHGQIRVFGKKSTGMPTDYDRPLEPIPTEYWSEYKFSALHIYFSPDECEDRPGSTEPIGEMMAYRLASLSGHGFSAYFDCHVVKAQLMSVFPRTTSQRWDDFKRRIRWRAENT